jgi:hypothetical protein
MNLRTTKDKAPPLVWGVWLLLVVKYLLEYLQIKHLGKIKIFRYIIMAIKKYVKRVAKKVGRIARKRYAPKGKVNYSNIVKDVKFLKSVLNPEKKTFQYTNTDQGLGQCSGNVSAFYVSDITPLPAQGTTSITRNGNSVRLHSSYCKFQFQQQSANVQSPMRLKIQVIQVMGTPYTSLGGLAIPAMYNANSFITGGTIIDYNSDRNTNTFGTFKVLREKRITLPANIISGQHMVKTISFGMKYKSHHVKFALDGSQTIQSGQILLLILADNGNSSTGTASTLAGTQATAVKTGALTIPKLVTL